MLNLSVPWEENMEETFERQLKNYLELVKKYRSNQWQTDTMVLQEDLYAEP